ncbi:hypothetical protein VDG1235_4348 [Verrucomicrobiia bacterium DG1235]|nr:hypothetical protein VDG1235_4348 [Verrucomicrobiae bacterium DG1235]
MGEAVTSAALYAIESFPSSMELRIQSVHALHGLAFAGVGELVVRISAWR